jgi:hypothetical protein
VPDKLPRVNDVRPTPLTVAITKRTLIGPDWTASRSISGRGRPTSRPLGGAGGSRCERGHLAARLPTTETDLGSGLGSATNIKCCHEQLLLL